MIRVILIGSMLAIAWNVVGAFAPWWWALPDVPIVVTLARCGAAQTALASDAPILPVVLADSPDGVIGPESDDGRESCDRVVSAMRAEVPALELVWSGWLCRSARAHAMREAKRADLWAGSALWIVDGRAVGGWNMYDALTARGIRYTVENGHMRIVRAGT